MNQMDRDMRAVRTVITQQGPCGSQTIALHAGECLGPAINKMVEQGELSKELVDGRIIYSLVAR